MKRQHEEVTPSELCNQFIGWQCRLRQLAVREDAGRPSNGMRPRITPDSGDDGDGNREIRQGESNVDRLVVLIVEREPEETTAHLRHLFRRTQDPRDRFNQVLSLLRAGYYQYPNRFSDAMTALFSAGSSRAAALLAMQNCVLHFEQYSRAYRVPCALQSLDPGDPLYQATFHHNAAFNPAIPPNVEILSFKPDWNRAATWQDH